MWDWHPIASLPSIALPLFQSLNNPSGCGQPVDAACTTGDAQRAGVQMGGGEAEGAGAAACPLDSWRQCGLYLPHGAARHGRVRGRRTSPLAAL